MANLFKTLIPLAQFDREGAAQIFKRLNLEEPLAVLNGDHPLAVLLSPEEYRRLKAIEEENEFLININRRMAEEMELPAFLRDGKLPDG